MWAYINESNFSNRNIFIIPFVCSYLFQHSLLSPCNVQSSFNSLNSSQSDFSLLLLIFNCHKFLNGVPPQVRITIWVSFPKLKAAFMSLCILFFYNALQLYYWRIYFILLILDVISLNSFYLHSVSC